MATQVQNRRGTTAEHSTFTGANGELTVDTTKRTLVVHDGATAGGRALLREDQSNLPTSAPTTGIYNASGSLAISTNGTKRIEIQADGDIDIDNGGVFYDATNNRLGIGDTGPDSTVTIKAAAATTPLRVSGPSSEFLRCDQSGRLLVGTSSTSDSAKFLMQGNAVDPTGGAVINLCNGKATPVDGEATGIIRFSDNTHAEAATIMSTRDGGTWSGTSKPSRLTFSTTADGASSPTERMRIHSGGNVSIWNSEYVHPITDNATGLGLTGFRWASVWAANGTIQTSDQRTKTNVADAALGTDFIKALRPVSYKWIEGGKRDTGERDADNNYIYESVPGERTHWGFIAQEVKQAVDAAGVDFGGWVLTDKNDPDSQQALRYDQFIAPLTKALQEALAEIDVLKAKVAALETA